MSKDSAKPPGPTAGTWSRSSPRPSSSPSSSTRRGRRSRATTTTGARTSRRSTRRCCSRGRATGGAAPRLVRRLAELVAVVPAGLAGDPDPGLPRSLPPHLLLLPQGYYRSFSCRRRPARSGRSPASALPRRDALLLFQNLHRYALYFALALRRDPLLRRLVVVLARRAASASASAPIVLHAQRRSCSPPTRFGCHSFRHLIGGQHRLLRLRQDAAQTLRRVEAARPGSTSATCSSPG